MRSRPTRSIAPLMSPMHHFALFADAIAQQRRDVAGAAREIEHAIAGLRLRGARRSSASTRGGCRATSGRSSGRTCRRPRRTPRRRASACRRRARRGSRNGWCRGRWAGSCVGLSLTTPRPVPCARCVGGGTTPRREPPVKTTALFALVLVPALALAQTASSNDAAPSSHVMVKAADTKWGEGPAFLPKGVQAAVVYGDPSKAGPFTLRLKAPAGGKIPRHWHPTDEQVTIIEGDFHLSMGEAAKRARIGFRARRLRQPAREDAARSYRRRMARSCRSMRWGRSRSTMSIRRMIRGMRGSNARRSRNPSPACRGGSTRFRGCSATDPDPSPARPGARPRRRGRSSATCRPCRAPRSSACRAGVPSPCAGDARRCFPGGR